MLIRRCVVGMLLLPPWALFMLCCWWYFWDTDPPAVHTSVAVMDEAGVPITQIHRGGRIVISRESCVTGSGKAFYTRTLVLRERKLIYFMPSGEVVLVPGCYRRFNSVDIPAHVEPGRYEYTVTILYQNNPLVDTRIVLPIPTFEVLP